MLRNPEIAEPVHDAKDVLNEVLSLNAQESPPRSWPPTASAILNEVLSLNAQECAAEKDADCFIRLLNEVLSLNAQESQSRRADRRKQGSSMKS